MTAPDEKQIMEALAPVSAQAKISGLQIRNGQVLFAVEVDPARGTEMEPLRAEAEKIVAALPGVKKVTAILTAQRGSHGGKPGTVKIEKLLPQVKHVIAVSSGKGGVGKSTVAVNLAAALAQDGLKAGLLDADIYGPSVPHMTGLQGQKPLQENDKLIPLRAHGLEIMSIGFIVGEDMPLIWRGPMVQTALQQLMRDVAWSALDVLIIDMPPGTGDAQLTLAQKAGLSGAVIVSTPQDIALIDARKGLEMFNKTNVPVLGIVENMSSYICPRCEHEEHIFGQQGARNEAQRLGIPFLGEIPLHPAIRLTADEGTPVALTDAPQAAPYRALAEAVKATLSAAPARKAG